MYLISATMADRIIHHCTVKNIVSNSYRLKESADVLDKKKI